MKAQVPLLDKGAIMNLSVQHNKCSNCVINSFCLPSDLTKEESNKVDQLINQKTKLMKGEYLYKQGDPFIYLFSIRYGSLKTQLFLEDGRSQIVGFHLPGEILGLDGISHGLHQSEAIALEDTELCVMKFSVLEQLCKEISVLQQHLYKIFSKEISLDHRHLLTLGTLNGEEKIAYFFVYLSERLAKRGLPPTDFHLAMGREEIGDYLGMKIETVSRILAKLNLAKIIEIKNKELKILNLQELHRLAGSEKIPTKSLENHYQLVNITAPVDSYKLKQGFEEA